MVVQGNLHNKWDDVCSRGAYCIGGGFFVGCGLSLLTSSTWPILFSTGVGVGLACVSIENEIYGKKSVTIDNPRRKAVRAGSLDEVQSPTSAKDSKSKVDKKLKQDRVTQPTLQERSRGTPRSGVDSERITVRDESKSSRKDRDSPLSSQVRGRNSESKLSRKGESQNLEQDRPQVRDAKPTRKPRKEQVPASEKDCPEKGRGSHKKKGKKEDHESDPSLLVD